jgi:hypothetical protein
MASLTRPHATVGFGCPGETDPHHVVVDIPPGRTGTVLITEHYGIKAGINGLPEIALPSVPSYLVVDRGGCKAGIQ